MRNSPQIADLDSTFTQPLPNVYPTKPKLRYTVRYEVGDESQDALENVELWIHRLERSFERSHALIGIADDIVRHRAMRIDFLVV